MSAPLRLPGGVGGGLLFLLLLLVLLRSPSAANGEGPVPGGSTDVFNIVDFGAVPDGETDATNALLAAWGAACGGGAVLEVPQGTFLVGPVALHGPCRGPVVFWVEGVLMAPADPGIFPDDYWFGFEGIDGLTVTGGGTFDGQGASAWSRNSGCSNSLDCNNLPRSIRFRLISRGTIQGISSVNSKYFHIEVLESQQIKLQFLTITAPGDSPNTDGVHVAQSSGVAVVDTVIGTGDDCVSIGPGATDLVVSNVTCGPGHGISVGSLGKYPGEQDVRGVSVWNCTISDAENGARIKTWRSPFASSVYNITFEDLVVRNVTHPIIIDQDYCPHVSCDHKPPSLVTISNVEFRNIRGTSASKTAVSLVCSSAVPCRNVCLQDIDLEYADGRKNTISNCSNVLATFSGYMDPAPCSGS